MATILRLYETTLVPPLAGEFKGDIKLFFEDLNHIVPTDIKLTGDNKDVVQDQTFETAIKISLFTNKRADADDLLPDEVGDKQGWVGDEILNSFFEQDIKLGSKLWLLSRSKMNPQLLSDIEEYSKESLQWMIDFNIADRIESKASKVDTEWVEMNIIIYRPGDDAISYKYLYNWTAQIFKEG